MSLPPTGRVVLALALLLVACGRTQPVRYSTDGGEELARGPDGGLLCVDGQLALAPARPVVMLVVDRSTSMNGTFNGSSTSKWNALRAALKQALPPWNDTLELGLHLFPGVASATCGVSSTPEQPPTFEGVASLLAMLDRTSPGGSTPTALAVETSTSSLIARRAAGSAKALVLATDGAPDCNAALNPSTCTCVGGAGCNATRCLDDVRTIERISSAAAAGIPTWIIGLRSSNDSLFVDVLNRMADAGGKPQAGSQRFFSASSQAELERALSEIRRQVGACHYLTTSVPDPGGTAELRLEGQFVPYDPMGLDGWTWIDAGNGEIALHGSACARAEALPLSALSFIVACAQ